VIRTLLVDDQPLIRSGIRALLDSEDDVEVVGEAADGQAGVELATQLHPDIVLMDVQMRSWTASRRPGVSLATSGWLQHGWSS